MLDQFQKQTCEIKFSIEDICVFMFILFLLVKDTLQDDTHKSLGYIEQPLVYLFGLCFVIFAIKLYGFVLSTVLLPVQFIVKLFGICDL